MPGLNLNAAARIAVGGVEAQKFWMAGAEWTLPAPASEWASVSAVTGAPIVHDYVADGFEWTCYQFVAGGTVTFATAGMVEYLVVAGGGGGGTQGSGAGGGGAGGFLTGTATIAAGEHVIEVGAGGAGGSGNGVNGSSGQASRFAAVAIATGGGAGAGTAGETSLFDGGSGGGAWSIGSLAGYGVVGQGHNGAAPSPSGFRAGGGGGGAGAAALPSDGSTGPSHGGAGRASSITGAMVTYGGGGGGSTQIAAQSGNGGAGGGGAANSNNGADATPGTAGTGGGGGACRSGTAGAGGSGVVCVRIRKAAIVPVNPEAGLTLTSSFANNEYIPASAINRSAPAVFACDIQGLNGSTDGVIFEVGGSGTGAALFVRGGRLILRAGNGAAEWPSGASYIDVPCPSGHGTLVFEIATGNVRLWWQGVPLGSAAGTWSGSWAGANDGSYMSFFGAASGIPVGAPTTGFAGYSVASSLRYYANQAAA